MHGNQFIHDGDQSHPFFQSNGDQSPSFFQSLPFFYHHVLPGANENESLGCCIYLFLLSLAHHLCAYISFFSLWPILCGHVHQLWKRTCIRWGNDGSRDGLTGVKHLKAVLPATLRYGRRCLCAPLAMSVAPAEVSSLHSRTCISNHHISFLIVLMRGNKAERSPIKRRQQQLLLQEQDRTARACDSN